MEMKLLQKEAAVWIEEKPILKRQQLSAEAVIPDSREDARSLVWTRGGVQLKGKEPSSRSCSFTGEVWACVLYLTESGKTETLRISREFEMSLDLEGTEPEAIPQISWQLASLEGRLVNPRKLGVSFDLQAEIRSFRKGTTLLNSALPEDAPAQVHLLQDSAEALLLRQVREKPFSLRERLSPGGEVKAPRSIAAEDIRFVSLQAERLGARCIVKGELELRIWGSDETELPTGCSFRIPFSQLAELDGETEGEILVRAEPCSLYLEWMEGAEGERSLDAEIHGLLQLRVYARQLLGFASDGYSSRMPSVPIRESVAILRSLKRESLRLSAEESLPMPEDLQALLAAEPFLGPPEWEREKLRLPLTLDLLVRRADGSLDALRRSFRLQGGARPGLSEAVLRKITAFDAKLEDGKLKLRCEVELNWEQEETESLEVLTGLELDVDSAWDPSRLPALSLVMCGGESLWDLAKEYHSSVELIKGCNPEPGRMLLIPAE